MNIQLEERWAGFLVLDHSFQFMMQLVCSIIIAKIITKLLLS